MTSMNDVAVRAAVSKATVSRVLNGTGVVSPAVREKVLAACRELNYTINSNIQDLILKSRTGSTRNIAFVMVGKEFADPAYARLVDEISTRVNRHHYHLMLVKLSGNEKNIYDLPPVLRDERVDGILLSGSVKQDTARIMEELGIPCVVVGNYDPALLRSLSSVRVDQLAISGVIGRLVASGKKRIAFVEEVFGNYSVQENFSAYRQALAEHGLPFDEGICYFGKGPFSGIYEVLEPVFLKKRLPFDSILCPDFRLAGEVSHLIIGRFGLGKPIDLPVAVSRSFDYYKLPIPAIYIEGTWSEMTEAALDLLIERIEGRKGSLSITIHGTKNKMNSESVTKTPHGKRE